MGGLRCRDVGREVEEQLVLLTGGRDRRGGALLTLAQNPRRERAKPEDYRRLLEYLLGVPWYDTLYCMCTVQTTVLYCTVLYCRPFSPCTF